jgi:hypothetical protein
MPSTASPWHRPGWQTTPEAYLEQAPAPSQVPSRPQVDASAMGHERGSRGRSCLGTKAQVPTEPATSHRLHVSVQALEQQTPSTHELLAQSPSQTQGTPFALRMPTSASQVAASCGASTAMSLAASVLGGAPWPPHPGNAPTAAASAAPRVIAAARVTRRNLHHSGTETARMHHRIARGDRSQ